MFQGGRDGRREEPPLRLRPARDRLRAADARAHRPLGPHPAAGRAGLRGRGVRDRGDLRSARRDAARQRAPAGARRREWSGAAPLYTQQEAQAQPAAPACRSSTTPRCGRIRRCAAASATPATSSARRSSRCSSAGERRSCSPATSASPGRRWSPTRRRSRRPTCCWSSRPTATATTRTCAQTLDELAYALNDTLRSRKGNVVIPAFAVGRTQELLHHIGELRREGRLPPKMQVYVDSPMALAATRITLKYARLPRASTASASPRTWRNRCASTRSRAGRGDHLGERHVRGRAHPAPPALQHLAPECAIVFVGFQAAGTLGPAHRRRRARRVRLFGEEYPVRAKVFTIGGLSAHADRSALLGWLGEFPACAARRPGSCTASRSPRTRCAKRSTRSRDGAPRCRRKATSPSCKPSA